jgi:transketolase
MNIPGPERSVEGLYYWRKADRSARQYNGTVVLQGSEVAIDFFDNVLPKIDENGLNINVLYVSSAELFWHLPENRQREIYPDELALEAIGITGFTMPTMHKWVLSAEGRERSLYPFKAGHYLGSGKAEMVIKEGGLDGDSQWKTVLDYAKTVEKKKL